MAWMQRLRIGSARADTAQLEAQVSALEMALERCRSLAGQCGRVHRSLMASVVAAAFVLGIVIGASYDAIAHGAADLVQSLGRPLRLSRSVTDAAQAYRAYQTGDFATALRVAQPLAEDGDVRGATLLGLLNYHGRGTTRSDADAMKWFSLAAEKGDAEAQYHLALMLGEGQSIPENDVDAATWYRRAAAQGHAQAQYNLGLAYARGEGVAQDNVRAHMWFNIAATRFAGDSRGRAAAVKNRDVIAGKMSREDLAEAQRLAGEWRLR